MPAHKAPLPQPRYCERCGKMIAFCNPAKYSTKRFCSRACASSTVGENTANIRPRRPTPVDIRFCDRCGWIIPRKGKSPSRYLTTKYCSSTCMRRAISVLYTKESASNYSTIHKRVYRARGIAASYKCEFCPEQALDWAWIHGKEGSPEDFMPLCRKCHVDYDGVAQKSIDTRHRNGTLAHTDQWREAARARVLERYEKISAEERSATANKAWTTRRAQGGSK